MAFGLHRIAPPTPGFPKRRKQRRERVPLWRDWMRTRLDHRNVEGRQGRGWLAFRRRNHHEPDKHANRSDFHLVMHFNFPCRSHRV